MNIKLLPYTGRTTVDIGAVAPVAITPGDRARKPYPPGNPRVNGDAWPNGATYHGDVTLTWAHRNRRAQQGWALVRQDAASVAIGPEGNYTVEVLIDGAVVRTQAGIAGTSFTYALAQRTSDNPNLALPVRFRITPVNGSLSGAPRTTDPFYMQP